MASNKFSAYWSTNVSFELNSKDKYALCWTINTRDENVQSTAWEKYNFWKVCSRFILKAIKSKENENNKAHKYFRIGSSVQTFQGQSSFLQKSEERETSLN